MTSKCFGTSQTKSQLKWNFCEHVWKNRTMAKFQLDIKMFVTHLRYGFFKQWFFHQNDVNLTKCQFVQLNQWNDCYRVRINQTPSIIFRFILNFKIWPCNILWMSAKFKLSNFSLCIFELLNAIFFGKYWKKIPYDLNGFCICTWLSAMNLFVCFANT